MLSDCTLQFVFCDNGTKKHPKLYGFTTLEAAARAFDVLTCKRALEKGRTPAALMASTNVRSGAGGGRGHGLLGC